MTVSRRKRKPVAKQEDNNSRSAESGVQYHCDICGLDISSTVRISCATCASAPDALDTYDLCCSCFLEGAESGNHKAYHDYRVVEQHAYPIFCDDWGADEELLLIDGAQIFGLGNWADIADHIGNRTKEEVQEHYVKVYLEGRDGTEETDRLVDEKELQLLDGRDDIDSRNRLPVMGPNIHFKASLDTEEFQKRKRKRIEEARQSNAAFGGVPLSQVQQASGAAKPAPPKPLVSAPTSHSELATFMPGRLEFEHEHENDAENYVKDMEFGKVYRYGGEIIPSEMEALGRKADQGRVRMEGSARSGPGLSDRRGANKGIADDDEAEEGAAGEETQKADQDDDDDAAAEKNEDEEGELVEDEEDEEPEDQTQAPLDVTMDDADATADQTGVLPSTSNAAAESAGNAQSSNGQAGEGEERGIADWDEDEADLDLKLIVLDIYNERLDRRSRRKEFIFERNLIDFRRTVAAEKKRPKEERDLLNRVRHFAQMQTSKDFEEFFNDLCYEDALRRAAAQLQMYRRAGITNLTDAVKFDAEQAERARRAAIAAEGGLAAFPASGSIPRSAAARSAARDTATPDAADNATVHAISNGAVAKQKKIHAAGADGEKKPARKPPKPLDLSQHPSLGLLTRPEQELCSIVRIQPQVYIMMKKDIIVEYVRRNGKFSRRESRQLFKCDVNKVGKVYDLLEQLGFLREANRLGSGWGGVGTPPGWVDKGQVTVTAANGGEVVSDVKPVKSNVNGLSPSPMMQNVVSAEQNGRTPSHQSLNGNHTTQGKLSMPVPQSQSQSLERP